MIAERARAAPGTESATPNVAIASTFFVTPSITTSPARKRPGPMRPPMTLPPPVAVSNMPAFTPAQAANTTVHSSGMMVSVSSPRVAIASGRLPTRGSAPKPISAGPPK